MSFSLGPITSNLHGKSTLLKETAGFGFASNDQKTWLVCGLPVFSSSDCKYVILSKNKWNVNVIPL